MALQQPDMEVLNGSALSFTNELAKFSNIPAIVQGNAILNAIADLGDRLDGRLDNCFEQLTTRIRAAYVATELLFIAIQLIVIMCSDRNQIARLVNSACTQPTSPLTPLINSVNGNPIHQFPATVAVIDAMACEPTILSIYFVLCLLILLNISA